MSKTPWVARVASRFRGGFKPKAYGDATWRTIGREAEHPVVSNNPSTPLAFEVQKLWGRLNRAGNFKVEREPCGLVVGLVGPRYTFSAEVGIFVQPISMLTRLQPQGIHTRTPSCFSFWCGVSCCSVL